jgi:hypothetical protein
MEATSPGFVIFVPFCLIPRRSMLFLHFPAPACRSSWVCVKGEKNAVPRGAGPRFGVFPVLPTTTGRLHQLIKRMPGAAEHVFNFVADKFFDFRAGRSQVFAGIEFLRVLE